MDRKKRVVYSDSLRIEIIKLASKGSTATEICELVGISLSSFSRWTKKYKFDHIIDKYRGKNLSDAIEMGLIRLAKGYETTEIIKEYYKEVENPDDPEGPKLKIKVKTKVTKVAPDIKAIQVLAKKHNQEYSDKKEIDINHTHLHIDSNQISLRELQELRNPIEAEYRALEEGKSLESLGYSVDESDSLDGSAVYVPPSPEMEDIS